MISKKDLGRLEFIAKGAVGSVYRVAVKIPGHPPLAYKEVRQPAPSEFSPRDRQQALDDMVKSVAFRASLNQADRADLDEYTTWPIDMVEDNGSPCGLVMPLIPADFFVRTKPLSGPSEKRVLDLSWLCAKDSQAQVEGVDRSGFRDLLVRIALLAQLVYAVGRLHRHGVVYGDLSLKNVALAVNPPRVKLLDCDAAAPLADLTRKQMHSPSFNPPEYTAGTHKLQDERTDVYKLGLCIIRGLQQGRGVSQTRDPAGLTGKLDAHAIAVITRAVGADRARRPTAKELFDCLESNLLAKASPPTLHSAGLSRNALLRGLDIEVIWSATGGKEVRITGSNGLDIVLPDSGVSPARHVITPHASGEINVEVTNAHGSMSSSAGRVDLYDLPPFYVDLSTLSRPVMSSVPAVAIPSVLHALPPVPVVSTANHPVPRIELPTLTPITDVVAAMRSVPMPFQQLADVPMPSYPDLGAAAQQTTDSVHQIFDDAREQLRDHVAREVAAALNQGGTTP
ncbi:MAG TPA: hypothetical protein VFX16_35705 [Pseudonocardiaceae bacterium]|nr:hypothetical protein [Pseudonocardiaceae bacterium]